MAVYTVLDAKVISSILKEYDVGEVVRFEPISSGIENTNYFIWTKCSDRSSSQWVLTIFENIPECALPFYNDLTLHLQQKGLAVPAPQRMKSGELVFSIPRLNQIAKKFGVLVPKFEGKAEDTPSISLCQKVGRFTANMHIASSDFGGVKEIQHSYTWCQQIISELAGLIPQDDLSLLNLALERYQAYQALVERCPSGIVHGDLFRDNVLFDQGEISGVIDFYNAGKTAYLFDLAVIANDWAVNLEHLPSLFDKSQNEMICLERDVYDEQKLDALLSSYQVIRPFSQVEKDAWPSLLELAAFRFYLSRLKTKYVEGYQQSAKAGETIKSPDVMKVIMLAAMKRQ